MTAFEIVDAVEAMQNASAQARSWTGPSYGCHRPFDQPCTRQECVERAAEYAAGWATEAAHEANRLLEIAS